MSHSKVIASAAEAVADIPDGAAIFCGGFGGSGYPRQLVSALADRGVKDLTIIANNADHDPLFKYGGVRRVVCSYPLAMTPKIFLASLENGEVELELEPQGTLIERIRAAGAGLGGFLTPVGVGTELAGDKSLVEIDDRSFLLCKPLAADFAFIRAWRADAVGNLIYRHAARNFNVVMATAAPVVIAEVDEILSDGYIDPDMVHTAGVFVDRLVVMKK